MPRVLDLSRNNCLKLKRIRVKNFFSSFLFFQHLGFGVGQSAEQTARQGQTEERQTDRQRSAVLLLFQLLQKLLLYQCTSPTSVTGKDVQFEESQDKIV